MKLKDGSHEKRCKTDVEEISTAPQTQHPETSTEHPRCRSVHSLLEFRIRDMSGRMKHILLQERAQV